MAGRGAAQQVEPDEAGHVVRARGPRHLPGRPLLDRAAVLEHDDLVGQDHRVEGVVGDEHARPGEAGQVVGEVGADLRAGGRVERGQRLVEQEQPRPRHQRPGQGDPLGLPAGQLVRAPSAEPGQADPVEPGLRVRAGGGRGDAPGPGPEGHVVAGVQVREQQPVLRDEADGAGRRAARARPPPGRPTSCRRGGRARRAAGAARRAAPGRWTCPPRWARAAPASGRAARPGAGPGPSRHGPAAAGRPGPSPPGRDGRRGPGRPPGWGAAHRSAPTQRSRRATSTATEAASSTGTGRRPRPGRSPAARTPTAGPSGSRRGSCRRRSPWRRTRRAPGRSRAPRPPRRRAPPAAG